MKVTKSESVRMLLSDRPHLSVQDVAHEVGCDISLVYDVRKRHAKKIVAKRMRQGVSNEQVTIMQASNVLQDLVKDIKDLCISFDHSRDHLDVLWRDGLFQVPVSELNKTIDSIKYLSMYEH
jgi:predicted kinase